MSEPNEIELEISRLRGPALVAWLVSNTEELSLVAAALDGKVEDLAPNVPPERVLELCQAVRHASLEVTAALLAMLSHSDDQRTSAVLSDAIANARIQIQKIRDLASSGSSAAEISKGASTVEKTRSLAQISRR